jgi:esterase/lipase superfamily enzyme
MQKEIWTWTTPHLPEAARMARWGHFGTPVLVFPTAGGDFEEIERFHLIHAPGSLIETGRIKVYSVDGLAIRAWLRSAMPPEGCAHLQNLYDTFLLSKYLRGGSSQDFYFSSPLDYLPDLGEGAQLQQLRRRLLVLGTGEGGYEDPGQSRRMAHVIGTKGVPHRLNLWGPRRDHDWSTWREMLPLYLAELA